MRRLFLMASTLLLLLFGGAGNAQAATSTGSFHYLVGTGFLCGLAASACPDIARADNGDTIRVSGQGDLNADNKTASGGGTFEHHAANGTLIGSGTWTTTGLVAFSFFGCGGPGLPSNACGGRAALAVHLKATAGPAAGHEADGIMQVECEIGNPPPGTTEGIRLNVRDLVNFNESVSGFTVFIATS